jgi:capsid protein
LEINNIKPQDVFVDNAIYAAIPCFAYTGKLSPHSVIVFQFCRPVWERFVRLAVLAGHIPARDFDRDPASFLDVDWLPPKWDWVDPQKDANAEIMQINAGLKSRSQSIAERGYDAEEVDAAIAADHAREKELGLSFQTPPANASNPPSEGTATNA